jgi:anaerobic magnesium-protoporphyrin IX monomethyl ester cyclase
MKILLGLPAYSTDVGINSGLASISAYLKRAGHQVHLLYLDETTTDISIPFGVPDIIGLSITSPQKRVAVAWSTILKYMYPTSFQIFGGVGVTLDPESFWASEADALCIGEGEISFVRMCREWRGSRYEGETFDNIWYRNGPKPTHCIMTDLSQSPPEDYSIYDWPTLMDRRNNWIGEFSIGRGCPYSCNYCSNSSLVKAMGTTAKEYVRYKPIQNVISELKWGISHAKAANMIVFGDDTFVLNPKHLQQFLPVYASEIHLPFVVNVRPELLTIEIATLLKESGCQQVKMGVESGNEDLRRKVLNRRMSNDQIIQAFSIAHEVGLKTSAFMLIGVPGETPEMMQESLELLAKIKPTRYKFSVYYPFPGTPLYESSKHIINHKKRGMTNYYTESSLHLPVDTQAKISSIMTNVGDAVNRVIGHDAYTTSFKTYMAVRND